MVKAKKAARQLGGQFNSSKVNEQQMGNEEKNDQVRSKQTLTRFLAQASPCCFGVDVLVLMQGGKFKLHWCASIFRCLLGGQSQCPA